MQNNYCKSTPPRVYEAEKLRPEDKGGNNMRRANAAQVQSNCQRQMQDRCEADAKSKCMTNAERTPRANASEMHGKCKRMHDECKPTAKDKCMTNA